MKKYTVVNTRSGRGPCAHPSEILACSRDIPFGTEVSDSRFCVYILESHEWYNPDRFSSAQYFILLECDREGGRTTGILDEGPVTTHKIVGLGDSQRYPQEYFKVEGHKLGTWLLWCSTENVVLNPKLPPIGKYSGQIRASGEAIINELVAKR
ncbi:MAG: hypothetical protein NT077_02335, partial [Candidatus Taylorbacteria bacterium]|nr:hypothetical protein [Candidatus Taylorbacteria bacterium]